MARRGLGTARKTMRANPRAVSAVNMGIVWGSYGIIALVSLTALALAIHNIVVFKEHHDDRNKHTKSLGFSAFKNSTQETTDGVAVDVTDWQVGGAYPGYDNSKDGFNATSGVFTAPKEAIYTAIATVCFNASDTGVREVHLVTSGAEEYVAVGRVTGDVTSGGEQCVTVSQHQWLVKGAEVSVMAFTDSGSAELITDGTLFSVERIAKFEA